MKSIAEMIELLKQNWSSPASAIHRGKETEFTFVCNFTPIGVQVNNFPFNVPEDLKEFWSISVSAELFKDSEFSQWGLHILSPEESLRTTNEEKEMRSEEFEENDLVIGKFIGDTDLLVLSSDKGNNQYDTVRVALPIDPRKDWYIVASGFTEFLEKYIDKQGDKYWEVGQADQ
jgi:hypothetical protein